MVDYRFEDFTEDSYCTALALAQSHWTFAAFGSAPAEPHVLWRHDVDVSPNRALRLAQLEHERGLKATYFFLLHSVFYNCLENSTCDIIRQIVGLGHDVGLHFDVSFYPEGGGLVELEERIAFEAKLIGDLAEAPPTAVSFHNPTDAQLRTFDHPALAGLVNAYGRHLRMRYRQVSDSNGYWRFDRLHDVLAKRADAALHILTHPEWWTPDCRSPRDRILRAVDGRAVRLMHDYDAFLTLHGRENVR